jgi:hypothetical protein
MVAFGIFACRQQADSTQVLQNKITSLENKLQNTYRPGFGEFMSGIQAHHAKLWFAGQHQNWKLADFEVHEIMEAVEAIQKFQTERKESQLMVMIKPSLDSVNKAIEKKNPTLFKGSYAMLTNSCNNCHRATAFEFNVVKIPDAQSFANQDFSVNEPK